MAAHLDLSGVTELPSVRRLTISQATWRGVTISDTAKKVWLRIESDTGKFSTAGDGATDGAAVSATADGTVGYGSVDADTWTLIWGASAQYNKRDILIAVDTQPSTAEIRQA